MLDFNFNKYLKNNPLMKETNGLGNYVQPEKMFGSPDRITNRDYDYMTDDELDAAEASGDLNPSTAELGRDEELMEDNNEVIIVFNEMLKHMRGLIDSKELNYDDVQKLRDKLAEFFKQ